MVYVICVTGMADVKTSKNYKRYNFESVKKLSGQDKAEL